MDNFQLPTIKSVEELKNLFQQYQQFLSPENAALVSSLISEIEKGQGNMDKDKIKNLACSLQKKADEEKKHIDY
ncbi:MAG: hypothetical protein ACOX7H_04765 [Bacillota bacterium]|jgi:hypothetical protein